MRAATFAPRLFQLQWQGHPLEKQSSEKMRLNGVLKDQRGNESTQLLHLAKNVNESVPVEQLCGQTTWSSNQYCHPRRPSKKKRVCTRILPCPSCRSLSATAHSFGWRDKNSTAAFPTAGFPWAIMLIASSHKAQGHLRATGCRPQPETTCVHGQRTNHHFLKSLASSAVPRIFPDRTQAMFQMPSSCSAHNRRTP